MRKEILIWHQGALGDLILSLPAFEAIKTLNPGLCIHLACTADLGTVILGSRIANEVSLSGSDFYSGLFVPEMSARLREFLSKFSKAYLFSRAPDPYLAENFSNNIPEVFAISTVPPAAARLHVSEYQLGQIHYETAAAPALRYPRLEIANPPLACPAHKKTISLHPGSGGAKKCWPLERYFRLIAALSSSGGYRILILLGPAEEPFFDEVHGFITGGKIEAEILKNLTLGRVADLLRTSSVHVGNDSGITHLAAALGIPTIAIFGPTDPLVWGPAGAEIVTSDSACAPCGNACLACNDLKCLNAVTVEEVIEKTLALAGLQ